MATNRWLGTFREPAAEVSAKIKRKGGTQCPCCGTAVTALPSPWTIEPCGNCKRPLALVHMIGRHPSYQLRNVLDLVGSAYGVATVALVLAFVTSGMDAKAFAKAVTVLLFVIGSLLMVDGVLSLRTGVDRTFNITRRGVAAAILGGGKLCSGIAAFILMATGISI
ncbi:hypothetical protein [Sphingomonas sp. VNH70]|uniref:hypothetical protein n=1 Tax=Sphingomonas silueang TaxID=3156617 RepID=UPI0032B49E69